MVAGRIGTLDVTEFTLETEIDDLLYILRLELFGIDFRILFFGAIGVDGVEHFGKAAAKFYAQTAVGTEAENTLHLGAQILFIKVSFVRWIVGRNIVHDISRSDLGLRSFVYVYT